MRLDRRTFLIGAAGAGLLAACGGDNAEAEPAPVSTGAIAFLVPTFPDGFRTAVSPVVSGHEARIAYVVRDEATEMRDNAPSSVEFLVTHDDAEVFAGSVDLRSDGIITPYYPIRFLPPASGVYTVTLPDHPTVAAHQFTAVEPADNVIPLVDDVLPTLDTPTVDDPRGVSPICTRAEPCPFHAVNLRDALAAGDKPVVLSVATPGFCQTTICGPVVDLLIDEAAGRDDLYVVHAEVYVDPQRDFNQADGGFPATTEAIDTLGLPFEPVLFVARADGIIAARLDTIYDRSELAEALATV